MKGVSLSAIIGRVSSRVDGSIGFSVTTPELSEEEAALFLKLHGKNVSMTIVPTDYPVENTYKIDKEAKEKTPSERLRDIIFVYYKETNAEGDFETFYRKHMEAHIETYKEKLQ